VLASLFDTFAETRFRLRSLFVLLMLSLLTRSGAGQTTDTVRNRSDGLPRPDTTRIADPLPAGDSISRRPLPYGEALPSSPDDRYRAILQHHPWFGFGSRIRPPAQTGQYRMVRGKESFFYVLLSMVVLFGVFRRAFPKYFTDLFRVFFRTTLKQRQIREQLMLSPLPSLLLNGFFVLSAGYYVSFLLQHYGADPVGHFWVLFLYCCAGLSLAYLVKFSVLKLTGWLFHAREAAEASIFVVFIVNKMIGLMLLPFLVLLTFTASGLFEAGLVLSWCLLGGLYGYRFLLSYAALRREIRVNPFHFLIYILGIEVAPLLVVYRALVVYIGQTA
jgi:hypothetical protein